MAPEQHLSDVLSEFARTMVTDFPIQAILDHLVERIVDIMPITAAGVTLISPDKGPRYVAASNADALRFEQLQSVLAEGPCLAAYRTGEAVAVPDLRADERFGTFAPHAVDIGLEAVFAFPLRNGTLSGLGALDLYRDAPGPLDDRAMYEAQILADVAAAYILNAQAREDLQEAADRFRESALHDPLTGLPNRVLFGQLLDRALLRARRRGTRLAILFADLDRFKDVNDLFGHRTGDDLLIAVANRLTGLLRPNDTLARLAGDEFVILCEDLEVDAHVESLANRIDVALNRPFRVGDQELHMTASVGVAIAESGEEDAERILHDADTAMYQAKRRGGAGYQILDLREQEQTDHRISLGHDLHGVLDRDELRTQYQPIVALADGRIIGLEALVRWQHPHRGRIPPALLIPISERSHVISDIGGWVLEHACRDRARWQRAHDLPGELGIAVNVSTHELLAEDYISRVAELLDVTGTDPHLLTIEVTETVLIADPDRAQLVLRDLKGLGVRLALDDFGTGYSSLTYLQRFPVDIVKIDQSFVSQLGEDPTSRTIVGAVVDLAHALGMTVIAEGAETAGQYHYVGALGCDACQGFYLAPPMPADGIDDLLRNRGAAGHPVLSAPVVTWF